MATHTAHSLLKVPHSRELDKQIKTFYPRVLDGGVRDCVCPNTHTLAFLFSPVQCPCECWHHRLVQFSQSSARSVTNGMTQVYVKMSSTYIASHPHNSLLTYGATTTYRSPYLVPKEQSHSKNSIPQRHSHNEVSHPNCTHSPSTNCLSPSELCFPRQRCMLPMVDLCFFLPRRTFPPLSP